MALLSLSAAARTANVSRQTIHTYINSSKIATKVDNKGNKVIDTAELLRVFGALQFDNDGFTPLIQSLTPDTVHPLQLENDALKATIELLRDQLFKTEQRELRLLDQVEKLTDSLKMIEHRPEPVAPAPKKPQTFWQRVFNTEE